MKGMGDLMKQAQAMQEKMASMQEEIKNIEVEGEAGAGLVKVRMTGRHDIKKFIIDQSVFEEDRELLEDLCAAAVNDAVRKVEESNKSLMSDLTGGLQMPPGFKMPF